MDRPPVPAAAQVRAGQYHDRGPQGYTAAGAGRGARVEDVQGGRGHLDSDVRHRGAGRDRRRAAGRRARVVVLRVQSGNRNRRRGAGPDTRHRSVRGHGQVPAGGRGAPRPYHTLLRQSERDQPERVPGEGARRAVPVRRAAGSHHHIDKQRQGNGGPSPVRRVRPVRYALRGQLGAYNVRAIGGPAQRGRPAGVCGRVVGQRVRLHATPATRFGAVLPVRPRRRRILQQPGRVESLIGSGHSSVAASGPSSERARARPEKKIVSTPVYLYNRYYYILYYIHSCLREKSFGVAFCRWKN